jgi:hypothetical protein
MTTGASFTNNSGPKSTYNTGRNPFARSRSVVVPNLGGFASFSACYSNSKLSFGYRADFFFGAMVSMRAMPAPAVFTARLPPLVLVWADNRRT